MCQNPTCLSYGPFFVRHDIALLCMCDSHLVRSGQPVQTRKGNGPNDPMVNMPLQRLSAAIKDYYWMHLSRLNFEAETSNLREMNDVLLTTLNDQREKLDHTPKLSICWRTKFYSNLWMKRQRPQRSIQFRKFEFVRK